MARIVTVGAGVVGLATALLLAKDGHEVVVLERDAAAPGGSAAAAWSSWERRGVNQFRLPHLLLARLCQVLDRELPEVAAALEEAGALRFNAILDIPEELRGPAEPRDGDFTVLTARRPVYESVLAAAAAGTAGIELRRGTAVESLCTDGASPVPRITGVRTAGGEEVAGDLVVDLSGRRSAFPRLLQEAGARAPREELDDSGFMYLGRHFESEDGSIPVAFGPPLMHVGTATTLTLGADNGTWGLVIVINAADRALLGLRDVRRWEAAWRAHPLVAHWLDGSPIDDGVTTMSKIEDRIRTYVVGGVPVATGFAAVGDAWSCSNPTHGRGVSIGTMHGIVLRDTLRDVGLGDPEAFALAFHEATESTVRPWFEWTRRSDRHRLAEVDALIDGCQYEPNDEGWEFEQRLDAASGSDPKLLRALVAARMVLTPLDESLAEPALRSRVDELGADWREREVPGPTRAQLVAIATD